MYHSLLKISLNKKEFKENQVYPEAIEHGIKEEENAKFYYSKVNEKKHCSFDLEEPGFLIISSSYSWTGASLDGIRKCQCCDPSVVKFHLKGRILTLKLLSCYQMLVEKKMKMRMFFWTKIIYIISKFRLAWQLQV